MPEADVNAFNLHFESWCMDRLPGLVNVKPFEFFCADQFLKARSLSDAEILSGQVDASDDGGVDSFYCFLNNVLLDDTTVIDPRSGDWSKSRLYRVSRAPVFHRPQLKSSESLLMTYLRYQESRKTIVMLIMKSLLDSWRCSRVSFGNL